MIDREEEILEIDPKIEVRDEFYLCKCTAYNHSTKETYEKEDIHMSELGAKRKLTVWNRIKNNQNKAKTQGTGTDDGEKVNSKRAYNDRSILQEILDVVRRMCSSKGITDREYIDHIEEHIREEIADKENMKTIDVLEYVGKIEKRFL
jgi:hypothetical protein